MRNMKHRLPRFVAVAVIGAAAGPTLSQAPDRPGAVSLSQAPDRHGAITLEDALRRALAGNPALAAARLEIDAERARRDAGALPPPLVLETEVENVLGSGAATGIDAAETTLQLSKVVELGGKQRLRADVAGARVARARLAEDAARAALAGSVTASFVEVVAAEERVALAREAVRIAERTVEIVRARVAAGRSSAAEEATAEIGLSRAAIHVADMERGLASARMRLATRWGASSPDFTTAAGNLFELPEVGPFEPLASALENNPELARLAAETRIGAARLRLAEARQRPDLSISAGVRHLASLDAAALLFSLDMPFGNTTRARPEIREANALLAQSPLTAAARRLDLLATVFALHQELVFTRAGFATLQGTVVPAAEEAVALYEKGFAVGSETLLELTEAQGRLVAARRDALDMAARYHAVLAELESLVGGAIPQGASR